MMNPVKAIALTNGEAWAIDFCVRQPDGQPHRDFGKVLLLKVFSAIQMTQGKPDDFTVLALFELGELWAIESQVRHLYREGNHPTGVQLLLKVQAAILEALQDDDIEVPYDDHQETVKEGGENDASRDASARPYPDDFAGSGPVAADPSG